MELLQNDSFWETATILLGGVATLAIFSFLIKENPLYRFFEHLFIGIATGLSPVLILRDFFWPSILEPMLGLNKDRFPDGTLSEPYNALTLLYIVPMAIGLLYYFIYSRRYSWLAKIVIGISLGTSGALAVKGFFAEMIPQLVSSFKPLIVFSQDGTFELWSSFNNTLFICILILVTNYFFFTFGSNNQNNPESSSSVSRSFGSLSVKAAVLGRPLLMVCFGAFFGSTVMARQALLVERVQFLIDDWSMEIIKLFGFGG